MLLEDIALCQEQKGPICRPGEDAAGATWPGPGWAPLPQMASCFHVKQVVGNALCIL